MSRSSFFRTLRADPVDPETGKRLTDVPWRASRLGESDRDDLVEG